MVKDRKLNVALVYNIKPNEAEGSNGKTIGFESDEFAEWDTEETIFAVRDSLALNNNVTLVEANENCFETLRDLKPDIAFNIAEGKNGINREAHIPAILEFLGIPYTGSDPLTLSSTLNKARTKEILSYYNIPNPKFIVANFVEDIKNLFFDFPVIVKPIGEGSSKGIFNTALANNYNELTKTLADNLNIYKQPCIIEEFLPGREFTVAILGNHPNVEVFPIVEINFASLPDNLAPIYSYEAKWIADTEDNPLNIFACPANIDKQTEDLIKRTAINAYNCLNCRDWSRIDIRLDKNNIPNIIEINPLPGILPKPESNSCYPKAARANGLNYDQMINKVLEVACKRYNIR